MGHRRAATVLLCSALALAACTSHASKSASPNSSAATSSEPGSRQPSPSTPASSAVASSAAPSPSPSLTDAANPAAIWPTYHHDAARTGNAGAVPAVTALKVTATAKLDAAIYASPLVLRDSKGDLIIAASENNTLYGLRNTGSVVWSRHIGTPVNGSSLPCGDISPTGITSTPVYDATSGLVFAVAYLSGGKHELVAVNAETGALAWTKPVDAPGSTVSVEQQRGALLLADGRVWVAYGGLYGDCGPYHGFLVGVATSGQGAEVVYRDPGTREGGFWAPTGPAADAAGNLYVPTGNGAATSPRDTFDLSDGIIEVTAAGKAASYFAPPSWASDNARDYGTTGVVLLPTGQLFIDGKSGIAYLLKQGALGGVTGAVPSVAVCRAFGGPAYANGMVYVPCTDGVRAVRISGTTMSVAWHATPAGSPIVGGGVVLAAAQSAGVLYALNPTTGAVKSQVALGDPTTRFAAPAMSDDGFVYVGTEHGDLVIVATS